MKRLVSRNGVFVVSCFLCLFCVNILSSVNFAGEAERVLVIHDNETTENKEKNISFQNSDYFSIRLPRKKGRERKEGFDFLVLVTDPHEQELLRDAADGKWDTHTTLSAALIAEGVVDDAKLSHYRNRLERLLEPLKKAPYSYSSDTLARKAFETLHQNLLVGGYDQNCTHLAHCIDTGHFNCVSATILYHDMAESLGLDVCGLEIRGHALSRVKLPGNKPLDLETTCANWFDIRHNPALQQEAIRRVTVSRPIGLTGQSGVPTTGMSESLQEDLSRRSFREISAVQLIATIYYNQGVDFINARKFDQSMAANIKSLHLDPENENAWGNLLATINNQALDVSANHDYAKAVALLKQGLVLDPDYELFQNNLHCIYFQWITAEADEDLDTAMQLCEEAIRLYPDRKNLRFLQYKICHAEARKLLEAMDFHAAFTRYDQASRIAPDEIRTAEIEVSDVLIYARTLHGRNQHARCVELLNSVINRHGSASESVVPVVQLTAFSSPLPEMTVSQRPFDLASSSHITLARVPETLLHEILELRTQVVSEWAGESFRTRDYPEAVRRIDSGATNAHWLPRKLSTLLADIHRQWINDLQSEGRQEEADYLEQQVRKNPYLQNH